MEKTIKEQQEVKSLYDSISGQTYDGIRTDNIQNERPVLYAEIDRLMAELSEAQAQLEMKTEWATKLLFERDEAQAMNAHLIEQLKDMVSYPSRLRAAEQQIADLKRCPCCGETRLHVVCGCGDGLEVNLADAERACSCETLVMAESQLIETQTKADMAIAEAAELRTALNRIGGLANVARNVGNPGTVLVSIMQAAEAALTFTTLTAEHMARDEKMRKALEFYADQRNWPLWLVTARPIMPIEADRGAIAREALASKEG